MTRAVPPPGTSWAPHSIPSAAVGQPVIVTEGVKPGWGAMGNGTWGQSADARARDQEETRQRRRASEGPRGSSGWMSPADLQRDNQFFERSEQRSSSHQQSNQGRPSHYSHREARVAKARGHKGKRKYDPEDSSDDERVSVHSQSAYRSEPHSTHQRSQRDHFHYANRRNPSAHDDESRYDRANAYITEQGSVSDATDTQSGHSSRPHKSHPPPGHFSNFSNNHPASYNQSETKAKEALYSDRVKAIAAEEAARESTRLARMHAKGQPKPPRSDPIRPQDSTLKPTSPFVMPATLTPMPMQQLTTPTSAATKQAISQSYQNDKGLTIYPPPHSTRPSPPPLARRPPGTPVPNMREVAEFEASLELASDTMTMEDLAASSDFSLEQKGIIFQMILTKQSTLPALPAGTPPPPDSHDQEMLAPLSADPDDAVQLIKNRESARPLEQSHTSAPLLGSAMETAARGLSISGSLPPNAAALPHE